MDQQQLIDRLREWWAEPGWLTSTDPDKVDILAASANELAALRAEVERLRNENAWLKRRYRVSAAKMDGKHVWIPGARWPKLVGNTMDEAVKYAMQEEAKGY